MMRQDYEAKRLEYTPNAIILGHCGAGKTTALNLLCSSQKKTKGYGGSVTQELFCLPVNHGKHAFNLIDTPGVDSGQ